MDRIKLNLNQKIFNLSILFFLCTLNIIGVQLQHSWAWGNNVNLLAAGASYPQSGTTGTGIYAGNQGDLISVMVKGQGERKLYKARVPKNNQKLNITHVNHTRSNRSDIHLLKDPKLQYYNSAALELTKSNKVYQQLCQGDLCCTFEIVTDILNSSLSDKIYYKYRFGVFDGRRTYEKEEWSDIQVCALYACTNDDVDSCGEMLISEHIDPVVIFKFISIKGTFAKSNQMLIMPTTLDDQLYSLNNDVVNWNKMDNGLVF